MELTSLLADDIRADLDGSLDAVQAYWDAYDALHAALAKRYGVYIVAGSFPKDRYNVAPFYGPNGKIGEQYKAIMTRFEREDWIITPRADQHVFDTELGKIGIAICLDSEFPLRVRALTEQGAELILVPSCTETLAGYYRVKVGCQARALENQCYVAQSPLVGDAPWSPATDINTGAAGLYGPPDVGFPDNGIIAMGEMNQPGWVYAEIHPARVGSVRRHGRVQNFQYWDEQKT
jgi:predicted amidohydrolase